MYTVYQIAFYTGILYTVVAFILGEIFHIADLHIDTHIEGDIPFCSVSPFKPITIAAFITVFGGVGIMGVRLGKGAILTGIMAVVIALAVAGLIYFLVIVPLYKAQNTSIADHRNLKGVSAIVTSPILENGYGEISYSVNQNEFTAPAKYIGKAYLGAGEEVFIVYIENDVFYVDSVKNS
jgi:hypothetical protein